MKDGIIILNKPQEWTSSDCVAICRRALRCRGIKKVGHGGTLDPMATGVLPIFIGQATRIMEYMELDYKSYKCTARLGLVTETLDIWGEFLEEISPEEVRAAGVTEEAVRSALMEFEGHIEQIPPKYSAVRINGRRLYDYAYKGEELDVTVQPRKVHIRKMEVLDIDLDKAEVTFQVECSKGTYIRTICSDLGQKLGCGCAMTALQRTATGNITIDQAKINAEDVKSMDAEEMEKLMLPADYPLIHFGEVEINEDRASYFSKGNSIWWTQVRVIKKPDVDALLTSGKSGEEGVMPANARGRKYDTIYKVYQNDTGEFLGTGYYDKQENRLKADKVFIPQR